jgi:proteasome accessory factor C
VSTAAGAAGSRTQVNRLLALVPYLQSKGEVRVDETAKEFGVRPQVILRDINVLLFCGLPGLGMGDLIDVDFDALEGEGVIRLSNADFLTRPLRLDSTEAAALVVGLRALLEGSTGDEREVVERTLAKVEEAAGEAAGIAAQVDVRLGADSREQELRRRLTDAVTAQRQVRLSHRSAARDEVTVRVVDPIAVSTSEGHAYLDAYCHLVEDRRLFRLDRVAEAEVLDTPVSAPVELEPLDLAQGIFRPSPDDLLATLRLGSAARWVTEYYPVESVEERPDGGLLVRLRVGDPGWLVRLMLRLGGSAELLEPTGLADEVRQTARRALNQYS